MWPFDNFPSVPGSPGMPALGGLPTPGAWPQGVPNPFNLPSPGQIGSTVAGWFSNPYGTTGTQGNQNPWGGINPYDTRYSQPAFNPGTTMPSYGGDTTLGQSGGFAPLSQLQQRTGAIDPNTLKEQPKRPPVIHETAPPPITGGHMGGGVGAGDPSKSPWAPQWLYHQGGGANAPWQHAMMGSSVYGKGG